MKADCHRLKRMPERIASQQDEAILINPEGQQAE